MTFTYKHTFFQIIAANTKPFFSLSHILHALHIHMYSAMTANAWAMREAFAKV